MGHQDAMCFWKSSRLGSDCKILKFLGRKLKSNLKTLKSGDWLSNCQQCDFKTSNRLGL